MKFDAGGVGALFVNDFVARISGLSFETNFDIQSHI